MYMQVKKAGDTGEEKMNDCKNVSCEKETEESELLFTGERFVPGIAEKNIVGEHYQRYHAVLDLVKGKKVLDAACGAGYGSALMSTVADEVTGVDISVEAVAYASKQYASAENLNYRQASIAELPYPDNCFDVIISFETIEHVNEETQNKFLKEIKRCLKKDGVLVMSSPDKRTYSDIPQFKNEFHVREFYFQEFDDFLRGGFAYVNYYTQGEHTITAEFIRSYENEIKTVNISDNVRFDKDKDLYYLAVCSNREIDRSKENIANIYGFEHIPTMFSFIENEYKAENMIVPRQFRHDKIYVAEFDLKKIRTNGRMRFDPLENACCEIEIISVCTDVGECVVTPINAVKVNGNIYTFVTTDPIVEVVGDFTSATFIKFEYSLRMLSIEEVSRLAEESIQCLNSRIESLNSRIRECEDNLQKKDREIQRVKMICQERENELTAIKSTRGYRLLENMRKLRDRV